MWHLAFAPLAPAALAFACALVGSAGARPGPSFVPAGAPTPVAFAPPAIARLVTHDRVLSIRVGAGASRFDVEDREGRALAGGLAEADLRARFPELHELIDPLRGARAGAYLDASVDTAALGGRDDAR